MAPIGVLVPAGVLGVPGRWVMTAKQPQKRPPGPRPKPNPPPPPLPRPAHADVLQDAARRRAQRAVLDSALQQIAALRKNVKSGKRKHAFTQAVEVIYALLEEVG